MHLDTWAETYIFYIGKKVVIVRALVVLSPSSVAGMAYFLLAYIQSREERVSGPEKHIKPSTCCLCSCIPTSSTPSMSVHRRLNGRTWKFWKKSISDEVRSEAKVESLI